MFLYGLSIFKRMKKKFIEKRLVLNVIGSELFTLSHRINVYLNSIVLLIKTRAENE